MRLILFLVVLALSQNASAIMCFKSGEQVSGMNKICYYRCPSGTAAITVASYELCPLNIEGNNAPSIIQPVKAPLPAFLQFPRRRT
jgi:hypothetical protein